MDCEGIGIAMAYEVKSVSFKNGSIDIVGNIRMPNSFDANEKYTALVIVTPGSNVKEQIGAF